MTLTKITQTVNSYLAGENLPYSEIAIHLDSVIDDLNHELNAIYPAFSEFNITDYSQYPNYDFFPERYIRSVVCLGAAFKFFITDEEGAESAVKYEQMYQRGLYMMQRDFSRLVPLEFQAEDVGYLDTPQTLYDPEDIETIDLNPTHYLSGDPLE